MNKSVLRNERLLAVLFLIAGCVLFWIGAFLPIADKKGTIVYLLPLREQVAVAGDNVAMWQWATALFIAGAIMVVFGLTILTAVLRDAGERIFSHLGLAAVSMGAIYWVIFTAFRGGAGIWAAQEMAQSGTSVTLYEGLSAGAQWLFLTYTMLTILGFTAYGAALLQARLLPAWVGWVAIVYGIAELAMLLLTGDVAPLLNYAMPFLFGILLLLRRYGIPANAHDEAQVGSIPASAS